MAVFVSNSESTNNLFFRSCVVVDLYRTTVKAFRGAFSIAKPISRRRSAVVHPVSIFEDVKQKLSSASFKRAFRVSKEVFEILLKKVSTHLKKNVEMGERSKRKTVLPNTRLAITLRMLAGGSYLDVMIGFNVGQSTAYSIFHKTRRVLMKILRLPGIPATFDQLNDLALGFKHSRRRMSPLSGCIGALDGIAIKIRKPSCRYAAAYYCRKGYYALPVQALVDSSYRFMDVSIRCVGSTHDALAHSVSRLGRYLAERKLPLEYWIAGDEAYVCNESLISPIPLSQVKYWWQDGFNFFLSSLRIHVEQAFGMLVARWRILGSLEFDVSVNSEIVVLCVKLHNFCVNNNDAGSKCISEDDVCQRNDEVCAWYDTCKARSWEVEDSEFPTSSISCKREDLVAIIKEKGLKRPSLLGVPTACNGDW